MKNLPKIVHDDPWLEPFAPVIASRRDAALNLIERLKNQFGNLKAFATGHLYYGLHRVTEGWIFREWAPNATAIYMIGEFNDWKETSDYKLKSLEDGNWEIKLASDQLKDKQKFKLVIHWHGGKGERLPSYTWYCVQDEHTKVFDAVVLDRKPYQWKHESPAKNIKVPIIYEAHVGMATEEEKVGSYKEFCELVLPRIQKAGYNTVQLMAVQEHPYYGSFGYHVSNYFAASSRFGTPDELKELIDTAHGMGMMVIMDLVHSHAVKNEVEGLGRFDGTPYQYFHSNHRREHVAWDSLCFDYGKEHVMHFLLSNCQYWLAEYQFDGYRFDGVTSMLYYDHGLERAFTSYAAYFDGGQDPDAINYLCLANELIHEVNPLAISIAEEMSGLPGLAEPVQDGGLGFNYRLAMGMPDYWIKIIKEKQDEQWNVTEMFYELTSRRANEKTISYAESHDQALVGDKTIIFRLIDKEMYWHMNKPSENLLVDRGMALHKMIRLITFAASGGGYLNFMGNEFGHPEWIDFPREGNGWSYKHARRQWSLADHPDLRYHFLADFDRDMIHLHTHTKFLREPWCYKWADNQGDQVLAFSRGELLFVFNFNPSKSFPNYGIAVNAGTYNVGLCTDSKLYGGYGNIDESLIYTTERIGGTAGKDWIKLYLPSRTALVLKKKKTASVLNL
ncbi:MAG: alpha amylase C-terminal domain-containing protein [Bacteroidota bacterium]|nr:MAG: alpha amylase C-terminal domain-containing protein [Bacteroidota bacterium]